jgi:hypothetical protein
VFPKVYGRPPLSGGSIPPDHHCGMPQTELRTSAIPSVRILVSAGREERFLGLPTRNQWVKDFFLFQ